MLWKCDYHKETETQPSLVNTIKIYQIYHNMYKSKARYQTVCKLNDDIQMIEKNAITHAATSRLPGPRLNIKTVLSTYGDFHVKDKTAVRTSYL